MKVAIICITGGRCTEISKKCFELPESGYDENEINDILVKQKYFGFDEDIYDDLLNNLFNPEWIGLFQYEEMDIVVSGNVQLEQKMIEQMGNVFINEYKIPDEWNQIKDLVCNMEWNDDSKRI